MSKIKSKGSLAGYSFYFVNPNCKRKVYFQQVCRLQPKIAALPPLRGSMMHAAREQYYKSGLDSDVLIDTYRDQCESNRERIDPERYDMVLKEGEEMLDFWALKWREIDSTYKLLSVEQEFPVKFQFNGKDYFFTIKPDLIYEDPMGFQYISDFKTTWSSMDRTYQTAKNTDEATLYLMGAEQNGFKVQGFELDILYKKQSRMLAERYPPIIRNKSETLMVLKSLARKIDDMTAMMQEAPYLKANPQTVDYHFPREASYSCAFTCDYLSICRNNIPPDYTPHGFYKEA